MYSDWCVEHFISARVFPRKTSRSPGKESCLCSRPSVERADPGEWGDFWAAYIIYSLIFKYRMTHTTNDLKVRLK